MRRYTDFRNNFAAGVLAPEYLQRVGGELTKQGLKTGTNCFITQAGTILRRPGSMYLGEVEDVGRLIIFDLLDNTFQFMVMRDGALDVYDGDNFILQTLPAPWTEATIPNVTVVNEEDRLIFVHQGFFPLNCTIDTVTGIWSLEDFVWRTDSGSTRVYAPFARFDNDGGTVRLTGYTGAQTAIFSVPFLTADYVGVNFLYGFGAQFRVTAVNSPTSANVDIIDRLYPTINLGVLDSNVFSVGDAVQTDVTQVRGIVTAVAGNFVQVALTNSYSIPDVSVSDDLIGPGGASAINDVVMTVAPAAIPIWFEELITPARGFPSTAALHRNRLCFAGFPQAPNLLVASAKKTIDDFDVGDGDDADSISARMGMDPNMKIKALSSSEQLFINTDRGTYYVDEGGNRLFTPSLINFNYISPDEIGELPPVLTTDGVVFIDIKDRVILATMTGTNRAAWTLQDISKLGYHLIKTPKYMSYSVGIGGGRPEHLLMVVNQDGTAAVFNHNRGSDQAGWVPWERGGNSSFHGVASWRGEVYLLAQTLFYTQLERLTFDAVIDGQWNNEAGNGVGPNGSGGTGFAKPSQATFDPIFHVLFQNHVFDEQLLSSPNPNVDYYGYDFSVTIEPAPMVIGQAGRQRRRAADIYTDVIDTGRYMLQGVEMDGYAYAPDTGNLPEVGDREDRASQLGSSYNRVITITQAENTGSPLHIRSITMRMRAK